MKKDDQIQFDNEVDASINEALTMIPKKSLSNLPMIKEYKGVPEWYDFEQLIWEKGEMIRQLISNNRTCELNQRQIEKIVQIATDSKAKRGRQSFVMLLGRKKYLAYAERIAQQICDDDVVGQTIVTLSKMHVDNFVGIVEPFEFYTKHTWVRNAAKKYLNKYRDRIE